MTYLKSIYVHNCYTSKNFAIDFSPKPGESLRHLILTGKNGSGKTTILKALDNTIGKGQFDGVMAKVDFNPNHRDLLATDAIEPKVTVALIHGENTKEFLKEGIYGYLKVERKTPTLVVSGPKKLELTDLTGTESLSQLFIQFLVNKKTEQAYAYQDGDQQSVQRIEQWFDHFEQQLQFLFECAELRLEFSRKEFNFYFRLPEQARFDFNQLSHGYASILSIITEILMLHESKNAQFSDNLPGIILIDEIENHLHLELQEKILPFLTMIFPQIQFIVATHSPAVIASIDNATVYDLDNHRTVNENLMGIPYHVLMKSHFGIESEYSRFVTEKLKEAKALIQKGKARTKQDNETLQQLARELDKLSPDLSLEIFLELEHQKINDKN
jgi:predicted ATP-binding protein involved in virulence